MNKRFIDKVDFYGIFSIDTYKNGVKIESPEEKNLIMDLARVDMAGLVGGINKPINKFVIGTAGNVEGNILQPIQVGDSVPGYTVGFDTTRTELFSEESEGVVFSIPFDANSNEPSVTITSPAYFISNPSITFDCTVVRTVSSRTVTYTVTIPESAANDAGGNPIAYTEAALYTDTGIFSMKTFSARVKDDGTKLEITWSIVF